MPAFTPIAAYNFAVAHKMSRATRALEWVFRHRNDEELEEAINDFRDWDPKKDLTTSMRDAIRRGGGNDYDLEHINEWPDAQKALVKTGLVTALDDNLKIKFRWDLTSEAEEETGVVYKGSGDVEIWFYSPEAYILVSPDGQHVTVGVGRQRPHPDW